MPFSTPYVGFFSAGDLLYGLSPSRQRLVIHLGAQILASKAPATVDQYRKSLIDQGPKADKTVWKSFLKQNEVHSKYAVYMQLIRSHNNDEEAFAQSGHSATQQNAAWRAKSKFGLEWTIKNQRGHIHFMLDDLDMGAVVTKTHQFVSPSGDVLAQDMPRGKAPANTPKERTITHSELRWIYRNRANPLVQANVQFWRTIGGTIRPCEPPWSNQVSQTIMPSGKQVSWAKAWSAYHPTHEKAAF